MLQGMNSGVAPVLKLHCVSSSTWVILQPGRAGSKKHQRWQSSPRWAGSAGKPSLHGHGCAVELKPAANVSVGEGCNAQQLVALPSWYPFSFPSQLRNAVLRASGEQACGCPEIRASPPHALTLTSLCL